MLAILAGFNKDRTEPLPNPQVPTLVSAPVLSGTPSVGSTLTVTNGQWNFGPTSYTIKWYAGGVEIVGQTANTLAIVSAYNGKTIYATVVANNPDGPSTAAQSNLLGPVVTPVTTVGGIVIGSAGAVGSKYEGFKLVYGDDFDNGQWESWQASNPNVLYATNRWNRPVRTSDTTPQIDLHPRYRGTDSMSKTAFGINNTDVENSIATLWTKPVDPAILPFTESTFSGGSSPPALMGQQLQTWPSFLLSAEADWIFEGNFFFDITGNKNGYWPAFWTSGMDWPNTQEMDLFEGANAGIPPRFEVNENGNTVDGGANQSLRLTNSQGSSVRFITLIAKKVGTQLTVWSDLATAGTPSVIVSSNNAKYARFKGPQAIKIDMSCDPFPRGQTLNVSQWPGYLKCDWFRVWVRSTAGDNTPLKILQTIDVAPGGSWNYTIPADSDLWANGNVPNNIYYGAWWDNFDNPGYDTKVAGPWSASWIPGGMTVSYASRSITGTVPTTDGGATAFAFIGSYADGTPGARSIVIWRVAPAVRAAMPASTSVNRGNPISLTIPYNAFHSGNLGPHTISVSKTNGSWLNITGNGTTDVTLSGTAGNASELVTLNITATNSVGQTTTVTRTITVP